jgi:hypothetical protein
VVKTGNDQHTSRFEVETPERRNYGTERRQQQRLLGRYDDHETKTTTTNKDHGFHFPKAIVAQLAECLHYFVDIAVILTGSGIVKRIKLVAFLTGGFAALSAMMCQD